MIIPYPTHLPKPLVSSNFQLGKKAKSTGSLKIFSLERIIKQNTIINVNFRYNLEEYIEFEDFYYYDIEEGQRTFSLLFFNENGELKNLEVDVFGAVEVEKKSNIFSVSFNAIVKREL